MNIRENFKCIYGTRKFGEIRIVCDNGKAYFSTRDVCSALGITEPYKFVNKYCGAIHRYRHKTNSGIQVMNFICFDDVINLCNHSRNDENAGEFLECLDKILHFLDSADIRLPVYPANTFVFFKDNTFEEDDYDSGYNYAEDYGCDSDYPDEDYCSDCEYADCDGDCENCDEYFEYDETENDTYKPEYSDLGDVLDKVSDMVCNLREKYGILVALDGVYLECANGTNIRVA